MVTNPLTKPPPPVLVAVQQYTGRRPPVPPCASAFLGCSTRQWYQSNSLHMVVDRGEQYWVCTCIVSLTW
jgi:hypothetical protein